MFHYVCFDSMELSPFPILVINSVFSFNNFNKLYSKCYFLTEIILLVILGKQNINNHRRNSHPDSQFQENLNEPLGSKVNSPSGSSSTSIATDTSNSQSQVRCQKLNFMLSICNSNLFMINNI